MQLHLLYCELFLYKSCDGVLFSDTVVVTRITIGEQVITTGWKQHPTLNQLTIAAIMDRARVA